MSLPEPMRCRNCMSIVVDSGYSNNDGKWRFECLSCGTKTGWYHTRFEALGIWNTHCGISETEVQRRLLEWGAQKELKEFYKDRYSALTIKNAELKQKVCDFSRRLQEERTNSVSVMGKLKNLFR